MRYSVAILLCTNQGERFLREQLASYREQSHAAWRILASDDGSHDATRELVESCRGRAGPTLVLDGPGRGFAANFLHLTEVSRNCGDEDFFAWSDQDDIWLPDKLSRAVAWLSGRPDGTPALYCGRTLLVDEANRPIGLSPLFRRPPAFANALCQSLAGGNTMVFNRAARDLLCRASPARVAAHDWWLYQLVAGCGGEIRYDPGPTVRYRQHGANLVGASRSWRAGWLRLGQLFAGEFRRRSEIQLAALLSRSSLLTSDNRRRLLAFAAARQASGRRDRLRHLLRAGIYRQFPSHTLALYAAALANRYP